MEPPRYVTLLHNPGSGEESASREELVGALRDAGFHPVYQSTKDEDYLDALEDPGDLVVIAGGDGTVDKVARHMSGRGIPLAVLPLGTANNIARTLGVLGRSPQELIAGLKTAERRPCDVGVARGPWGERRFLEAAGVGIAAYMMCIFETVEQRYESHYENKGEELHGAFRTLQDLLKGYEPHRWEITLDGRELSGTYLLVEAMNIRSIGPNLDLAPEADFGDGSFDVVLVSEAERDKLKAYVEDRLAGRDAEPGLTTLQGRHLQFSWDGADLHVDDKLWPRRKENASAEKDPSPSNPVRVEITLESHALEFLVPRARR